MNDNIKAILEGQKIREKLRKAGIYPMVGPRGPKGDKGDGISILGDYESYEELIKSHPTGNTGDCYLIGGVLYVWNKDKITWDNVGNIQGSAGPQGEKGIMGPPGAVGSIGPTGPTARCNKSSIYIFKW